MIYSSFRMYVLVDESDIRFVIMFEPLRAPVMQPSTAQRRTPPHALYSVHRAITGTPAYQSVGKVLVLLPIVLVQTKIVLKLQYDKTPNGCAPRSFDIYTYMIARSDTGV